MVEGDRFALPRNDVVHGYLGEYDEKNNHLLTIRLDEGRQQAAAKDSPDSLADNHCGRLIAAGDEVELLGISDPTDRIA